MTSSSNALNRESAVSLGLPPSLYHIGNYGGFEDCQHHWETPQGKTSDPVTFASLIHAAKMNATQYRVPFPGDLGRPSSMERSRQLFQSATSRNTVKRKAVQEFPAKPDGLYDGPEFALRSQPQWLVENVMIEGGYSIASGRSGAGKSFCELALALSICTGKPWMGRAINKTGLVVYVAAEGQFRIWNDVLAWCQANDENPESLKGRFYIFDQSMRLNTPAGIQIRDEVLAWIKTQKGELPVLIIFDTLRRNMRGGVSQEEPTSEVLNAVNDIQARGIAVTLVAHHGRGHGDTKGLTEWEDDADQVRTYQGSVRMENTSIEFKKIKASEDGWAIGVNFEKEILPNGQTTLVASLDGGRQLFDVVEANGRSAVNDELLQCAVSVLESHAGEEITRKKLAELTMRKAHPLLETEDATVFRKRVESFARKLGRTTTGRLSEFAKTKGRGGRGEILSFQALPSSQSIILETERSR